MKPDRTKQPTRTPFRNNRTRSTDKETEEVLVYCRIRPLSNESDESCLEVIDSKTLRITPPQDSRAYYNGKNSLEYTFSHIFDENADQNHVFCNSGLNLVDSLLNGKNGLLFTYGVTGSGKTYTMHGTPTNGGIMTRAIDTIFNSIEGRQTASRYLIESDKLNDFQVQSLSEAMAKESKEQAATARGARTAWRSNSSDPEISYQSVDTRLDIDQKYIYTVFISCCEIYNKYIYDLLDDEVDSRGKPRFISKNLREDAHGNMFVYGGTEIEVRSSKEALDLFYKGQKRRRVAQTQLNFESSRSHSVYNIRLVKCYATSTNEIDTTKTCVVSQLALVDLAGSERTSRTGNIGERLREAGNINNSLMSLRSCIERLRENQKSKRNGNVPYRNDKVTHLFKNYFEGNGTVRMIINVNPCASDYEESLNVLQFAEMTQEIQIEHKIQTMRELAMTPSRFKAQQAYESALNKIETNINPKELNQPYNPIYNLGPDWPSLEWKEFESNDALSSLRRHLENRLATKNTLIQDHNEKLNQFRQQLVIMENNLTLSNEENKRLKAENEKDKKRIRDLENRLVHAETANTSLQRRIDAAHENKMILENELDEKELELNRQKKESRREVRKLRSQMSNEKIPNSKRSFQDTSDIIEFKGVGSRIAELEARNQNCVKKKRVVI